MNIDGIASKIASNAEVVGALGALLTSDGVVVRLDSVISSVQQLAAGVFHAPADMSQVQTWAMGEGKNAIMAYIAAELIDAVKPPIIGKYANAIKKGALGYGAATLGVRLLYACTHSEIKGVNVENSASVRQNFANAPEISTYQY